ncbi:MAG: ATP-binding cassette domain-containing protein [Gracilibacteraceae bacterium]|jgi:oligopeptide/dipeptide ABC transporter ATP-binding protein|nr:ATP-binding cassette domain-containing protein [Gracilibacteraceae bacterium]
MPTGENSVVMSCENISKSYPVRKGLFRRVAGQKQIVRGVSFELERGRTLALVGESGCGKTVLLRVLLGIEKNSGGRFLYRGRNTETMSAAEQREMRLKVQMIFQDTLGSFHPRMSVREALEEPLILSGVKSGSERMATIETVLGQVGLSPLYLTRYPHQLSGGQRQRAAIARCLAVAPEIIFADEPISALDVSLQAQVVNMLMDLQDDYQLSILLVAHDLAVVRQIADTIMIMYLGAIVESAPAREIYGDARHPYTQALLQAAPSIKKGLTDENFTVHLKPGDLPDPANPPSGCLFRTRCVRATALCAEAAPAPREVSPKHVVLCHFAQE